MQPQHSCGTLEAMPLHGHNFTFKIRRNPKKVSMQHQHSCSTLESRIKIFGRTVQELYITFYPLDNYPLLHRACLHIKSVWRFLN